MTLPKIVDALITPNVYSRPGKPVRGVLGLVWHWVANPGTSAQQNRDYFDRLGRAGGRYAGAHYVIGLDGEILQCIPDSEMAYHCGADRYKERAVELFGPYPNDCTLGIEMCHPDRTGEPTPATLESLVMLSAMLAQKYNLLPCLHILRHYDITGKDCPKYMVENPEAYNDALGAVLVRKNLLMVMG